MASDYRSLFYKASTTQQRRRAPQLSPTVEISFPVPSIIDVDAAFFGQIF